MRTRVKICGITCQEDALLASEAGADALGFVFYPPSSRAVSLEQAAQVMTVVPAFVTTTALFVDATRTEVEAVIQQTGVDLLQFHGQETPEFCASFRRPYIKALRVSDELDIEAAIAAYSQAQAILLDAYVPGIPGGTGSRFDWRRVPRQSARPLILAGGLTPDNVAEAIATTQPWAVDVSGGVEAAPGRKDADKIRRFFEEVNRVNQS